MEKKPRIVLLLCMLMIISTILPASGTTSSEKASHGLSIGKVFYVGGLGPNNYTKIQDAIDDATFGDTVYVYNNSSPYREFIIIEKSINLIGENQDTTIIEGYNDIRQPILQLKANGIHLHGFTIQNSTYIGWPSSEEYYAVAIFSNKNDISGNIFTYNAGGIFANHSARNKIYENIVNNGTHNAGVGILIYGGRNNEIFNNTITRVDDGLYIIDSSFNQIHHNRFSQVEHVGILTGPSEPWFFTLYNKIYKNHISGAEEGITIGLSTLIFVYLNEITNCSEYGVYRTITFFAFVTENNFFNNSCNAYFYANFQNGGIMNRWSKNYWDDWNGSGYYTIHGETGPFMDPEGDPVPVEQYDRHPAQNPYDI